MAAKSRKAKPVGDGKVRKPESRKEEIVAATVRVIGRRGVAGASMRAIAREMGLTTGVISHHFADKTELLREALQTCFDPWFEALEEGKQNLDSWGRLRHLFLATIPAYRTRKNTRRVWLGLLMQIEYEKVLWDIYKSRYGKMRDEVCDLVRQCQKDGFVSGSLDPDVETTRLFALCDGLMVSVIGEPDRFTEAHVTQVLTSQVDALRSK